MLYRVFHFRGGEYHPLLYSISLNNYASLALSKNIDKYLKDSDKFLEVFTAIEEDSKTEKRNIRS